MVLLILYFNIYQVHKRKKNNITIIFIEGDVLTLSIKVYIVD